MPDGASLFMHKYGKTDSTLFCRMKNCIIHRDVNPADDIRNFRNALNDEMRCFSEDKNHRISYRSDLYFRKAIVKGKAFELIAREGEKPILMLFYKSTDMEITGNSCWKKRLWLRWESWLKMISASSRTSCVPENTRLQ